VRPIWFVLPGAHSLGSPLGARLVPVSVRGGTRGRRSG
jgi:hypothetical protein